MTVEKFITQYNVASDKNKFLESHIVTKYIDYQEKIAMCKNIVLATSYINIDNIENINKVYCRNSPLRYMLFIIEVLKTYTDIIITDSPSDGFNLLNKNGLIDEIIVNIPEREYSELNVVLHMVEEDFDQNERSILGYLENKESNLEIMMSSFLSSINEN